ncbi:P27 family phage terminase small subunit [Anaerococcus sp. AGMB09787]|uniref:P27 family phage terminase small subunit n=1 Tax=Anaerococcus sp. AGMB09787 TaxID=2922869 RepID=UPI001FAEDF6E|nr:P27 family phage terminase small subunit [Anaerococcus sp. AGMB09787]
MKKESGYDRLTNLNESRKNSHDVEEHIENDVVKTIIECMKALGTYDNAFVLSISVLDKLFSDYYKIRKEREETGSKVAIVRTDSKGRENITTNPLYRSLEKLRMDILSYLRDLGLTPNGLKKIKQDSFQEDDKVSKVEEVLFKLSQA